VDVRIHNRKVQEFEALLQSISTAQKCRRISAKKTRNSGVIREEIACATGLSSALMLSVIPSVVQETT
jgi:hypothetical protein